MFAQLKFTPTKQSNFGFPKKKKAEIREKKHLDEIKHTHKSRQVVQKICNIQHIETL